MEQESAIIFHKGNATATITLNRPEVRNAFDNLLIAKLYSILEQIENDPEIKIVVIQGTGDHFSSGGDLNWMQSMVNYSEEENFQDALVLARTLEKLNNLSKPTIALVKGTVYGGAVGLIACCDIAIAEESAIFCLSEVKLGLSPAVISPYVIEAIGAKNARRYMLTAELFSAEIASELGLINIVTKVNHLPEAASIIISSIVSNGSESVAITKELIHNIANNTLPNNRNIKEYTASIIAKLRVSKEAQTRIRAFLSKKA